jgi:hypothetical protein
MDISELPSYLPGLLIFIALVAIFVVAKKLSRRWLRWPVRGGATLGMMLTVLMLALFVFEDYSCTARAPRAYSPDGKYVVVQMWGLQGALGADIATVQVRHRYSPFAKNVYWGPGDSDYPKVRAGTIDPQVRWIDNKHLYIRYYRWAGYDQVCVPRALGIEVTCDEKPSPFATPSQSR